MEEKSKMGVVLGSVGVVIVGMLFITALMFLFPMWNVWRAGLSGEADLKRAEQTRMIQIQQAKGEKEAAQYRAEAIAIVGKAAKDFPEYRQQEFIGAFAEGDAQWENSANYLGGVV